MTTFLKLEDDVTDLNAAFFALAFAAIGIIFIAACKHFLNIHNISLTASIFIVPVLLFLIFSGRLGGFEGFGIKASFRHAANESIAKTAAGSGIINPEEPSSDAVRRLEQPYVQLSIAAQVVFIRTDQPITTDRERVEKALLIKNSILSGSLRYVIVIDSGERPLGYFSPSWFLDLVPLSLEFTHRHGAGEPDPQALRRQLMQTRFWDIADDPAARADKWGSQLFIPASATVAETFRLVRDAKADGALVTDQRGRYRGFVTANAVLQELAQALVSSATGAPGR